MRRQQAGGVVVVLLVLMLTASSVYLAKLAPQGPGPDMHLVAIDELNQVRRNLISYAVSYNKLYGPTGAGPGHLPCPDTDIATDVGTRAGSLSMRRREGPNPPCGNTLRASGKLPRHVVIDHQRFAFHDKAAPQWDYSVSTRFINNPINRIVNTAVLNNRVVAGEGEGLQNGMLDQLWYERIGSPVPTQQEDSLSAKESLATITTRGNQFPLAVHLYRRDLAQAVRQQVQIQVLEMLREIAPDRIIRRAHQLLCENSEPIESASLQNPSPQSVSTGSSSSQTLKSLFNGEELIALLEDPVPADAPPAVGTDEPAHPINRCKPVSRRSGLMQATPTDRHWFVRNRWYESLWLGIDSHCGRSDVVACSWRPYSSTSGIWPMVSKDDSFSSESRVIPGKSVPNRPVPGVDIFIVLVPVRTSVVGGDR